MPGQLSRPVRALGVLTGGGDVPGLNAAIKALVYRGTTMGVSVLGLRAGWEGITFLDRSRSRDELIFRADQPETWKTGYLMRSEERRVGKECRSRWWRCLYIKNRILRRTVATVIVVGAQLRPS